MKGPHIDGVAVRDLVVFRKRNQWSYRIVDVNGKNVAGRHFPTEKSATSAMLKRLEPVARESNPLRRGAAQRAPAANASRTRYIRRPSQITKKSPRKRLRKRRAKNFDRPTKGRFPNPVKTGFRICIQKGSGPKMHFDGVKFSQRPTVKGFPSQAIALRKAREFLAKFPTLRKYRVTVEPNFR